MTHIIVYTIPTSPEYFYIPIDGIKELTLRLDKLSKTGQELTVKVYAVSPINYKLKYKEKIKTVIEQEPEIEIL